MEIKDVEKALIRFDIKDERVSAVDLGPVGAFSDLVRSQGKGETLAPVKSFENNGQLKDLSRKRLVHSYFLSIDFYLSESTSCDGAESEKESENSAS